MMAALFKAWQSAKVLPLWQVFKLSYKRAGRVPGDDDDVFRGLSELFLGLLQPAQQSTQL